MARWIAIIFLPLLFTNTLNAGAEERIIAISCRYLNLPVSNNTERAKMTFEIDGKKEREFDIRLADSNPDYWVFCDVSTFKGKALKISYPNKAGGLKQIYQDDKISGQDSLYMEYNRPQFHFTTRRGWINDPNGLIFYEGEYHLFYQHNPYEREWGNMHWGHAVSKDLIHWEELPIALYPDQFGVQWSGCAIIDYNNTTGFGTKDNPAMVVIYIADSQHTKFPNQVECLAYSLDRGRTFTKYAGNPVLDHKKLWYSDPTTVFWYQPLNKWIIVMMEVDGASIYSSPDLKQWTWLSHVSGFHECPQMFELPVDGNKGHTKWIMHGASGVYIIGGFDGKKFIPETKKYYYASRNLYAPQVFSNIPDSDGRCIQMAWGRGMEQPGMPFNQMMLLPTELTLRSTRDGVRLFSYPVSEINALQEKEYSWDALKKNEADEMLKQFKNNDYLRIKTTFKLYHANSAGLTLNGQPIVDYNLAEGLINNIFYSPEDPTSKELSADIFIDKTSVEVFIDGGALSYSMQREGLPGNRTGLSFFGDPETEVVRLKVYPMKSIWN